jgi:hypothetical protein
MAVKRRRPGTKWPALLCCCFLCCCCCPFLLPHQRQHQRCFGLCFFVHRWSLDLDHRWHALSKHTRGHLQRDCHRVARLLVALLASRVSMLFDAQPTSNSNNNDRSGSPKRLKHNQPLTTTMQSVRLRTSPFQRSKRWSEASIAWCIPICLVRFQKPKRSTAKPSVNSRYVIQIHQPDRPHQQQHNQRW